MASGSVCCPGFLEPGAFEKQAYPLLSGLNCLMGKLQPGPGSFVCNTTFWGLHSATKHPGSDWQRVQEDKRSPLSKLPSHFLASLKAPNPQSPVPLLSSWYIQGLSLGLIFLHSSLFSIPMSTPASSSHLACSIAPTNSPAQTSCPIREMRWVPRSQYKSVCERGHQGSAKRYRHPEEGGVLRKSRNASRRRCSGVV